MTIKLRTLMNITMVATIVMTPLFTNAQDYTLAHSLDLGRYTLVMAQQPDHNGFFKEAYGDPIDCLVDVSRGKKCLVGLHQAKFDGNHFTCFLPIPKLDLVCTGTLTERNLIEGTIKSLIDKDFSGSFIIRRAGPISNSRGMHIIGPENNEFNVGGVAIDAKPVASLKNNPDLSTPEKCVSCIIKAFETKDINLLWFSFSDKLKQEMMVQVGATEKEAIQIFRDLIFCEDYPLQEWSISKTHKPSDTFCIVTIKIKENNKESIMGYPLIYEGNNWKLLKIE